MLTAIPVVAQCGRHVFSERGLVGRRYRRTAFCSSSVYGSPTPFSCRRVISKSEKAEKIKALSTLVQEAVATFYDEFDYYPDIAVYAPGKFTIMGDHLEYINSYVVQGALPMVTVIVGKSLDTVKCKLISMSKDLEGLRKAVFPIYHYKRNLKVFPEWVNYIKGVIGYFPSQNIKGFDAVIHSNVPINQGCGSSAALQVGFYTFLEAVCGKKICEKKEQKAEFCRLAEITSQICENKIGQWDNFTSSLGEKNTAITINCSTGETSKFEIKDINILFLLIYPNFEIESNDRSFIFKRELELKLAAKLLGLKYIKDATERDLEALSNMEDPTKEMVIDILREFDIDEEIIIKFVEELFRFPKDESIFGEDQITGENGELYLSPKNDDDWGDEDIEMQNFVLEEEGNLRQKKVCKTSCLSFDEKRKWMTPAPPPSPVSYIQQQVLKLCEGKIGSDTKMPTKICEEINCLGGIENLSVASDLTVMGRLLKRVRHVVTEKMRCLSLPDIIRHEDYEEFGSKLIQSHLSLKIDYEVSCPTLDGLVQMAIETQRVYGAKMMSGGGILTLLHRSVVEEFIKKLTDKYGKSFQFYLVFPSSGAEITSIGLKKCPKSYLSNTYLNVTEVMKKAVENFEATYKYRPTNGAYSPGIINMIGDHTDYNNGFVLSLAVDLVTVAVGAFNGTSKIRVATTADVGGEPQKVIFFLPEICEINPGFIKWAKLVKGVVVHFKGDLKGFDCLIESSVICGSGMASKTALALAFYTFLEDLTGQITKSLSEKAYRCMTAEHEFTNILCGVGEQNIAAKAKKDCIILFDTRNSICTPIPFKDPSVVLLLTFTKLKTKSMKSLLYTRMEECFDVAKAFGRKTLRCFTSEDFESVSSNCLIKINSDSLKRAKHVMGENERVLRAAEALKNNDFETLGALMIESHNSLRDLFEITTPELDCLVKLAMEVDGVLGSKMPCSGFQNCTLSLVKRWAVDDLIEYLQKNFKEDLYFFLINPSEACQSLNIKKYVETLPSTEFVFEDIFPF